MGATTQHGAAAGSVAGALDNSGDDGQPHVGGAPGAADGSTTPPTGSILLRRNSFENTQGSGSGGLGLGLRAGGAAATATSGTATSGTGISVGMGPENFSANFAQAMAVAAALSKDGGGELKVVGFPLTGGIGGVSASTKSGTSGLTATTSGLSGPNGITVQGNSGSSLL